MMRLLFVSLVSARAVVEDGGLLQHTGQKVQEHGFGFGSLKKITTAAGLKSWVANKIPQVQQAADAVLDKASSGTYAEYVAAVAAKGKAQAEKDPRFKAIVMALKAGVSKSKAAQIFIGKAQQVAGLLEVDDESEWFKASLQAVTDWAQQTISDLTTQIDSILADPATFQEYEDMIKQVGQLAADQDPRFQPFVDYIKANGLTVEAAKKALGISLLETSDEGLNSMFSNWAKKKIAQAQTVINTVIDSNATYAQYVAAVKAKGQEVADANPKYKAIVDIIKAKGASYAQKTFK